MSVLQAILSYQETDSKLYKLERELSSCPERKEFVKIKKLLDSAPEKLEALETKALSLKNEVAALNEEYKDIEERLKAMLEDFEHGDELLSSGADLSFYKKKVSIASERLKKLKADVKALAEDIVATDKEYQELKKVVITAEKKKKVAYESYQTVKAAKEPEMEELKKQLAALEKGVSADLLAKYQAKRKEKIFPVIGQLYDNRCPYCSMEPSIQALADLKDGETTECESCRRIIFR